MVPDACPGERTTEGRLLRDRHGSASSSIRMGLVGCIVVGCTVAGCDDATVLWVFLAPILIVVGLGALAAALFVVAVLVHMLIAEPFRLATRKLERSRALRSERRDLKRRRWVVLSALGAWSVDLARIGVELGPVEPAGSGRWGVARWNGAQVALCHRGSERVIHLGQRELSVAEWLSLLEEALAALTTDPLLSRRIGDMAALADAIAEANAFLPEPVRLVDGGIMSGKAEPPEVLAFVHGRVPYDVVTRPTKPALEQRFARFCDSHGVDLRLEDMEDLFPDARAAHAWLAASRLVASTRDEADEAPLQLYVDGERYVVLRFSFDEPWIVEDYPNAAVYLFDILLRPALEDFRRSNTLRGADRFPRP